MKNLIGTIIGVILGILVSAIVFAAYIPVLILDGYVLKTLWWWFVVPLGIQPIGICWALGLAGIFGLLKGVDWDAIEKKRTNMENIKRFVLKICHTLGALGIGWVLHYYMVH